MRGRRQSVVELKARGILAAGQKVSKYTLASLAPCDQRTAQRILARLHAGGWAYVAAWTQIYRHWIPVYKAGHRPDKLKPTDEGTKQ